MNVARSPVGARRVTGTASSAPRKSRRARRSRGGAWSDGATISALPRTRCADSPPLWGVRLARLVSVGAAAGEDRHRGAEEDLEVEAERPGADVVEVEADHVVEGDLAAAADLPEAGDPGHRPQPPVLPVLVLVDLGGDRRARADQAHLAPEDVQQLGQLVDAGAADDPPDASDPR